MKSANKLKQSLLLMLCTVMAFGILTQTAVAGPPQATGKCTNAYTEGIEYFVPFTGIGDNAEVWRGDLKVSVLDKNKISAGEVIGLEIEAINDNTRYQCTQLYYTGIEGTHFSCNSFPTNAIINGIYFLYRPVGSIKENTEITFIVENEFAADESSKTLYRDSTYVKMPPYPCARNILTKNFVAPYGSHLVYPINCSSDPGKQVINFIEQDEKYAIVNITDLVNTLEDKRFHIEVSPQQNFNYILELVFGDAQYDEKCAYKPLGSCTNDYTVTYEYTYDPVTKTGKGETKAATELNALYTSDLPLTLLGGRIREIKAVETESWGGTPIFPSTAELFVRFYYENYTGTIGYENSVFHFERNLNILFTPTCDDTASAVSMYDPCKEATQVFETTLPEPIQIKGEVNCLNRFSGLPDKCKILNQTAEPSLDEYPKGVYGDNVFFTTRKCVDSKCTTVKSTDAFPYAIHVSDGAHPNWTYVRNGTWSDAGVGTVATFSMKLYGTNNKNNKPFQITGVSMAVNEPGTYVIYAFTEYGDRYNVVPGAGTYSAKFYVTVGETNEQITCFTRANNGYFIAYWNECLADGETQLIPFEIIEGMDAWIENRSPVPIDYPYVSEKSYLPQKLEVASLNCEFEGIAAGGRPADGYCNHYNVHVPPYTRVWITGGTLYLESYPKYDNYYVAYMREDTVSISHLFFSIRAKACEKKSIPDTGISLRSPMSPLKVNESVEPATDYAFTGNSMTIPAIGLGIGIPVPIVHVYYEKDNDMVWDLSTLGNYIGELEGGAYIPYGGNAVLTGHYWSGGVFKNLVNLNYEDEIYIYANDGIKYVYKVVEKFVAQPDDVYEMFQPVGENSLTLVTCENYNLVTDEYERRYIVRAILASQEPYEVTW